MGKPITIREADSMDAERLTSLAILSKAFWGYSDEFMQQCVEELSVSRACIENTSNHFMVAIGNQEIVGFFKLENLSGEKIELGALFVEPNRIGTGVGRALIEAAKEHALLLGVRTIYIQSDPNAERFYRAAGAILIGRKKSESIPDRFLPTFEIPLSADSVIQQTSN